MSRPASSPPKADHPTFVPDSHTWYREMWKVEALVDQGKAIPAAIRAVMAKNSKLPPRFNEWVRRAYGLSAGGGK